jgi:hypothetical protein
VDPEEDLRDFVRDIIHMTADGMFELRGWKHKAKGGMDGEPETTLVLGLLWDKQQDVIFCDVSDVNKQQSKLTRRNMLSTDQRVFDAVGFCCPVTLYPKLLLQES